MTEKTLINTAIIIIPKSIVILSAGAHIKDFYLIDFKIATIDESSFFET